MPANRPLVLPVAEYTPDMPTLLEGSAYVRNVLPRTEASYGPCPSLQAFATSALSARAQGGLSALDPAGNVHVFTGTSTDLYRMTVSSPSFSNVSKSAAAYLCASDQMWRFTLFKDIVIATNIHDPIQKFQVGTASAFSDLDGGGATAPKAKYVAGVKNWLVAAHTWDAISGTAPWRVWWSAVNDATSWPTVGSSSAAQYQSDYNDIIGDGGWIQGIVGNLGTADAAIFFEHSVWRMNYAGPPAVFDFSQAQGARGTPAPGSIVQLGAFAYYLGEDGFYAFDGTTSQPIGANKIDKTFYNDADQSYLFRMCGAVDPINKMVLWAYAGSGHSMGNPNRLLAWNWGTGRWTISDVDSEYIFRSMSLGYSLDGLDGTGYNLDTLPFSLDSRAWTGGSVLLSGFDTTHTFGYFNGSNLAATVDTREIQPFNGQRSFVRNSRPVVDGGTPSVTLGTRELIESSKSFGSAQAINSLGWSPLRGSGRYVTARVTMPAASSFTHISGVELDLDAVGVR